MHYLKFIGIRGWENGKPKKYTIRIREVIKLECLFDCNNGLEDTIAALSII